MKRLLQAPMKLNLRSGLWVGAMSHERSCESIFWLSRFGGICFLVSGRAYSPTVCPITRPSWNPMVRSDTRTRWSDLCHEKKQSHNRIDGRYPGSMFQLRPSLWVRHLGWKGTRTMQAWRPNGRMIGGLKLHFGDAASKLSDLWGNMFLFFFWNPGNRLKKYIFNDSLDVFGCLRYCGKRNYGYPFFWDPEEIQRTTWVA